MLTKIDPIKNFVFYFVMTLLCACSRSHEVTTWNEWCDYKVKPEVIGIDTRFYSYDFLKIREDFVNDYNEILVEELVSNHFWDSTIHSNQAADNLIKAHKLGFWVERNQLHFANAHLSHEQFEGDVERFKTFLSFNVLKDNKYHLNRFQMCLYQTIDTMFESFIIHTRTEIQAIPLDFSHKGFFTKS